MSEIPFRSYPFYERTVELRQQDISATGAAVLVNSIGIKATFSRGGVAEDILNAAGKEIKETLQPYTPIRPGSVVVTHAGKLMAAGPTRYIFHTVITDRAKGYRADPELIIRSAARCIQLADLLGQESIAIPSLGSGAGRGGAPEVVRHILNQIIAQLPNCQSLQRIIFAVHSAQTFELFNARALVGLALARREQELRDALQQIPPALYGLVGQMLEGLKAAQQAGDLLQADKLAEQARGLVFLGAELRSELEKKNLFANSQARIVIQAVIATGNSIVHDIQMQANQEAELT